MLELNAGINIFCILTEDNHIYMFRMFDRGRHSLVIPHGTLAHVQI
jgi:hypothetical protein